MHSSLLSLFRYTMIVDLSGQHGATQIIDKPPLSREEANRFGLPDQDFLPLSMEQRLVPMIDSLVELDRPTTLEQRIRSINQRYHDNAWFLGRMKQAAATAGALLDEVNRDLGISLEQVAAETLSYNAS